MKLIDRYVEKIETRNYIKLHFYFKYISTINSQKRYIRISFLMHHKTTLEIPSDNLAWIILQSIIDALKSYEN